LDEIPCIPRWPPAGAVGPAAEVKNKSCNEVTKQSIRLRREANEPAPPCGVLQILLSNPEKCKFSVKKSNN
jgi:hypothetical protein